MTVGRRTVCPRCTYVSSYFVHVLTRRGVYFTQHLQLCGIYSRVASIRGNTVLIVMQERPCIPLSAVRVTTALKHKYFGRIPFMSSNLISGAE